MFAANANTLLCFMHKTGQLILYDNVKWVEAGKTVKKDEKMYWHVESGMLYYRSCQRDGHRKDEKKDTAKKREKVFEKVLTRSLKSDIVWELLKGDGFETEKERPKKLEKSLKKVLTRKSRSDILTRLTLRRAKARSSLKIEQQRQTKNSENSFEFKNTVVQLRTMKL